MADVQRMRRSILTHRLLLEWNLGKTYEKVRTHNRWIRVHTLDRSATDPHWHCSLLAPKG